MKPVLPAAEASPTVANSAPAAHKPTSIFFIFIFVFLSCCPFDFILALQRSLDERIMRHFHQKCTPPKAFLSPYLNPPRFFTFHFYFSLLWKKEKRLSCESLSPPNRRWKRYLAGRRIMFLKSASEWSP